MCVILVVILHTFYIVEHVLFTFFCYNKVNKSSAKDKIKMKIVYFTDFCSYLKYHNHNTLEHAIEKYLKWFYSFSDKTLVPLKHSLKRLKRRGYKNLVIWSRGIDTSRFNAGFKSTELRSRLGAGVKFAYLLP